MAGEENSLLSAAASLNKTSAITLSAAAFRQGCAETPWRRQRERCLCAQPGEGVGACAPGTRTAMYSRGGAEEGREGGRQTCTVHFACSILGLRWHRQLPKKAQLSNQTHGKEGGGRQAGSTGLRGRRLRLIAQNCVIQLKRAGTHAHPSGAFAAAVVLGESVLWRGLLLPLWRQDEGARNS